MTQQRPASGAEGGETSRRSLAVAATLCAVAVAVAQVGDFKPPVLTGTRRLMIQYETLREHVERDGPNDLVIVGDSIARQGIVPSLLMKWIQKADGRPLRAFNFGSGGVTALGLPMAIELLLGVDQPADVLLVVSLRMAGAWSDRTYEYTRYLEASPYGLAVLDPVPWRGAAERWLLDHVALEGLRYRTKRAWLGVPDPESKRKQGGYGERRGYVSSRQESESEMQWEWLGEQLDTFAIDDQKLATLIAAVRLLQERGTRVWIVEAPHHPRAPKLLPAQYDDLQLFQSSLTSIATKTGTEALLIPPAESAKAGEFADTMHLNEDGARRYSRWIARELARRGPFSVRPPDDS